MRISESRGHAFIEFVIAVPFLMMFILLAIDVGDWYRQNQKVTSAARDIANAMSRSEVLTANLTTLPPLLDGLKPKFDGYLDQQFGAGSPIRYLIIVWDDNAGTPTKIGCIIRSQPTNSACMGLPQHPSNTFVDTDGPFKTEVAARRRVVTIELNADYRSLVPMLGQLFKTGRGISETGSDLQYEIYYAITL